MQGLLRGGARTLHDQISAGTGSEDRARTRRGTLPPPRGRESETLVVPAGSGYFLKVRVYFTSASACSGVTLSLKDGMTSFPSTL